MTEIIKHNVERLPLEPLELEQNWLPLLPLKNVVLLPKSISPVIVGRPLSISAVEQALKGDKTLIVTAQKNHQTEQPELDDIYRHATRATILQVMRMPNGALKILVEGLSRVLITHMQVSQDYYAVTTADRPTTSLEATTELEAIWRNLQTLYSTYASFNEKAPTDLMAMAKTTEDMDYITDTVAAHVSLSFVERQQLLEQADLKERMLRLCSLLTKEIEILQMEQRIKGRVQDQVESNQREYYLTEQMKAIQKELGRDDLQAEMQELRAKIPTLGLSAEAREKVEKELRRLETMPPLSSEAVVSRNYIDWVMSLPWSAISKDRISLSKAEKILDGNHAGLKKAKERIIEFLAAKKFSKNLSRSPIICLVGPPGVGKTSMGKSIADSLGREFVRISLGGLKDEAEIRGHRRTYIGALPGKIVQAMRKAKTVNPVILLDEIDKIASDIHGDPSAALLEVLDPEQNKTFIDHFLEVEYDLSKVMFIATANMMDTIPYPLFDRMELINLSGYTEVEKQEIARKFLIAKNLEEYGLTARNFKLAPGVLETIIDEYTKEAGVRQLERTISKLMRKAIQVMLKQKNKKSVTVTPELLKEWLGSPPYKKTSLDSEQARIGLATGLAWTEVGGEVLEVETSVVNGKGGMTLTGQLGEVMQESAQAALSYIRTRIKELGLKPSFHSSRDIHVHLPEGATPKDGPSAGITMCTALVSALTKNPVKPKIAMTGEITLRGRVLAVGGLKDKLLAAKRHGMTTVVVSKENEPDIQDILKEVKLDLNIVYARTMDEVLTVALSKNPFASKTATRKSAKGKTAKKAPKRTHKK